MSQQLAAEWQACRGWLIPALERGDVASEQYVVDELRSGRAQLWRGERSAMVTQLVKTDAGERCVHVLLGGGALGELLQLMPGACAWSRVMGADWATINGRGGWARVLRKHGFELRDGELWKRLR